MAGVCSKLNERVARGIASLLDDVEMLWVELEVPPFLWTSWDVDAVYCCYLSKTHALFPAGYIL